MKLGSNGVNSYIYLVALTILLSSLTFYLPTSTITLPFKWVMVAFLFLFSPGLIIIRLNRTLTLEKTEEIALIIGLSLLITSLMTLLLSIFNLSKYFIITLIIFNTTLCAYGILIKKRLTKRSRSILSQIKQHKFILGITLFTLIIRLIAHLWLFRESIISDIDMWLVLEVENGGLLSSYNSIWHYLGLAPYSYPPLFHIYSTAIKNAAGLLPSQLLPLNILLPVLPILFTYCLVKNVFSKGDATLAALILSTTPIFIFNTLPETFKARAMFYGLIALEIFALYKALRGEKIYWIIFASAIVTSLLTYREAVLINFFLTALIISSYLVRSKKRTLRWSGISVSIIASIVFTFSYLEYTPSLGLLDTAVSTLVKFGPLLLFSISGIYLSLKKGNRFNILISNLTVVMLIISFVNWKAAETAPILIAPLAGVGLFHLIHLSKKYFRPLNLKKASIGIILLATLTTSIGLSYYPQKYYVESSPQIYDEIEEIRGFLKDKTQIGALVYGTGYTGIDIEEAYASIIILGPEQKPLAEAYALNYLSSSNYDPWIFQHPETLYESTYQLYKSLYSHHGENLTKFLETFLIQYLILERSAATSEWALKNKEIIAPIFSTEHYQVYEVSVTRDEIELLNYIERNTPLESKIISPYQLSPFLNRLREDFLSEELKSAFKFDYFHLLNRIIGRKDQSDEAVELKSRIKLLKRIYVNPAIIEKIDEKEEFGYIIIDQTRHTETSMKLASLGLLKTFSNNQYAVFEIDGGTYKGNSEIDENEVRSLRQNHALVLNLFTSKHYSETRYSIGQPASDAYVRIFKNQEIILESSVDKTGTLITSLPEGQYNLSIYHLQNKIQKQIILNSYTFIPILIPQVKENPTKNIIIPLMAVIAILTIFCHIQTQNASNKKPPIRRLESERYTS